MRALPAAVARRLCRLLRRRLAGLVARTVAIGLWFRDPGCSIDTVRRRIRRGELHAVQHAGRKGSIWKVLLGVAPNSPPTAGTGEDTPPLLEALRLVDALRPENRDLADQIGYLQARVQIHEEMIRALQAQEAPSSLVEAPGELDPLEPTPEPRSQSEPEPSQFPLETTPTVSRRMHVIELVVALLLMLVVVAAAFGRYMG
jgi:hypothetical protein